MANTEKCEELREGLSAGATFRQPQQSNKGQGRASQKRYCAGLVWKALEPARSLKVQFFWRFFLAVDVWAEQFFVRVVGLFFYGILLFALNMTC